MDTRFPPDKQRSYAEVLRRSWRLGAVSEALARTSRDVAQTYRAALESSEVHRWIDFVRALDAFVRDATAYAAFGALRVTERDDFAFFQRILNENADLLNASHVAA